MPTLNAYRCNVQHRNISPWITPNLFIPLVIRYNGAFVSLLTLHFTCVIQQRNCKQYQPRKCQPYIFIKWQDKNILIKRQRWGQENITRPAKNKKICVRVLCVEIKDISQLTLFWLVYLYTLQLLTAPPWGKIEWLLFLLFLSPQDRSSHQTYHLPCSPMMW